MNPTTFPGFYRRYAESCIAAGIEPRTPEYTAALIGQWELLLRVPAYALGSSNPNPPH